MSYSPKLSETDLPKYGLFPSLCFLNEFLHSYTIWNSGSKELSKNILYALYRNSCLQLLPLVLELWDWNNHFTAVVFT